MNNANGRGGFITLEGIEGAGKSSQIGAVTRVLREAGHEVITTREPGGSPLGEEIRSLLLSARDGGMAEETELLLVFAARAEHLSRVIRPALDRGQWVLCDRFTEASYAYQGAGRGMGMSRIAVLEDWLQDTLRPDLTLLFDLPVTTGLARVLDRAENGRGQVDRFESEKQIFFERVRSGYLQLASAHPGRFRLIDASPSMQQVSSQVEAVLKAWLDQFHP